MVIQLRPACADSSTKNSNCRSGALRVKNARFRIENRLKIGYTFLREGTHAGKGARFMPF